MTTFLQIEECIKTTTEITMGSNSMIFKQTMKHCNYTVQCRIQWNPVNSVTTAHKNLAGGLSREAELKEFFK